jgi:glycosyltransferase involved in cell wall biosynthesis
VVVPNGVDLPEEGVPGPAPGRKTLLYLSRFHPKKGGDLLLQAWSRLWRVFPDWRLRLVGPDAEGTRDAWRQLATGLGIDAESIQFEGPIEGAEKAACLTGAELFVLPSHSENFGNVVAESLAHGTPVVTTTATPWRGLEEKGCGWWVAPEASAIEAALGQAMALSRPDRLAMGRLGRAWMASDFSWRSVAQCFKEDYSRLSGAMGGRLGQPCSRGPNVP